MISFSLIAPAAGTWMSCWGFLLCITGIFGMIAAYYERQFVSLAALIPIILPGWLVWQMWYQLYEHSFWSGPLYFRRLAELSAGFWVLLLASETLLQAAVLLRLFYYSRSNITPQAIRICSDRMPCGLCYYKENGMVVFSNSCMDRLCLSITGDTLLNGNYLQTAIPHPILSVEDKIWRFSFRKLRLDGELLHEIVASDVTEIYRKTEELQQDNENLSRLHRELQEYNLGIDDMVRREEILQAKIYIHDEMNRLILSTEAEEGDDPAVLDDIFNLWKKNAQLLSTNGRDPYLKNALSNIRELAEALGIALSLPEKLTDGLSEEGRELLFIAVREAIANAAKHARASELIISSEERSGVICCTFENDGEVKPGPVPFLGGLANLARLAAEQGVQVSVNAEKTFCLTLVFPKEAANICQAADVQAL